MSKILDTTLRDGSYVIDFQFSSHDTAAIAAKLEFAGIEYIEIGHGLGLGAGKSSGMKSAEPDEAYLEAASYTLSSSKWGMFFIPGIGSSKDIEMAAKYGMDFIRIGTNVTETYGAETFIKQAKSLGLEVFANFMKTYALPADDVAELAEKAYGYGADHVCIVDSSGGMLPEEVESYIKAVKTRTGNSVGFHGHNNLGLANSNSLTAINAGASIVDSSIRGMGRGAGNAVTEMLVYSLKRKKIPTTINSLALLDLAEKIIDPLLRNYQQVDSIGIVSGYAHFHSAFLPTILENSEKYRIDPKELIIAVTREDQINAPKDMVERIAKDISNQQKDKCPNSPSINLPPAIQNAPVDNELESAVKNIIDKTNSLSKKWGRKSVVNIVQDSRKNGISTASPVIIEGERYIVSSIEIANEKDISLIAKHIDGNVDIILFDTDKGSVEAAKILSSISDNIKSSELLYYSDRQAWVRAITSFITEWTQNKTTHEILIVGENDLAQDVCNNLFSSTPAKAASSLDLSKISGNCNEILAIICQPMASNDSNLTIPENISLTFLDAWVGSFSASQIDVFETSGVSVLRVDMRDIIQTEIDTALATRSLIRQEQGLSKIGNIPIAARGITAPKGTVIVDKLNKPSKVLGIADGVGMILKSNYLSDIDKRSIWTVENFILSTSIA